jgi:hypothetical protein
LAAVETNECLTNNGGCWQKDNITACQVRETSSYVSPDCFFLKHPSENKNIFFQLQESLSSYYVFMFYDFVFGVDHFVAQDTFRGRICACPLVEGVQFEGDGYSNCQATGPGRCRVDNTGCWIETQGGLTFSACQDSSAGCVCPEGFTGDGLIDGTGCVGTLHDC